MEGKIKAFLDSNIFIAATLSSKGGSFRIIEKARNGDVIISSSSFVIQEVVRVLSKKYPEKLKYAYVILSETPISLIKDPTEKQIDEFTSLIDDTFDAPILAGATKSKADYLITLDQKHFMTEKLQKANLGFKIASPKDFLSAR